MLVSIKLDFISKGKNSGGGEVNECEDIWEQSLSFMCLKALSAMSMILSAWGWGHRMLFPKSDRLHVPDNAWVSNAMIAFP